MRGEQISSALLTARQVRADGGAARPYAKVPDSLLGFKRSGPNTAYHEQKWKHEQWVEVAHPTGDKHVDAIKGHNSEHALERARRNWPGASIRPISEEEAAKLERPQRADGGAVSHLHTGPIHSSVAGRTDHLPMHVPSGAYVLPADIVSALGEGNTMAGFKIAKNMFSQPSRTEGTPYAESGLPYGVPEPHKAHGGAASGVPIVAAGGEHVIHPDDVRWLGNGSLDDGHRILDEFVKQFRLSTVKTLSKLPGPRSD